MGLLEVPSIANGVENRKFGEDKSSTAADDVADPILKVEDISVDRELPAGPVAVFMTFALEVSLSEGSEGRSERLVFCLEGEAQFADMRCGSCWNEKLCCVTAVLVFSVVVDSRYPTCYLAVTL
jgi:hypothetical protein